MRRAALALAVTLVVGTAHAQSNQYFRTLGPGAGSTCGRWLEDRKAGRDGITLWALGFLSGVAIYHETDILAGLDAGGIQQWLDRYCRDAPLAPFASAIQALADTRLQQMRR